MNSTDVRVKDTVIPYINLAHEHVCQTMIIHYYFGQRQAINLNYDVLNDAGLVEHTDTSCF